MEDVPASADGDGAREIAHGGVEGEVWVSASNAAVSARAASKVSSSSSGKSSMLRQEY